MTISVPTLEISSVQWKGDFQFVTTLGVYYSVLMNPNLLKDVNYAAYFINAATATMANRDALLLVATDGPEAALRMMLASDIVYPTSGEVTMPESMEFPVYMPSLEAAQLALSRNGEAEFRDQTRARLSGESSTPPIMVTLQNLKLISMALSMELEDPKHRSVFSLLAGASAWILGEFDDALHYLNQATFQDPDSRLPRMILDGFANGSVPTIPVWLSAMQWKEDNV